MIINLHSGTKSSGWLRFCVWLAKNRTFSLTNHITEYIFLLLFEQRDPSSEKSDHPSFMNCDFQPHQRSAELATFASGLRKERRLALLARRKYIIVITLLNTGKTFFRYLKTVRTPQLNCFN